MIGKPLNAAGQVGPQGYDFPAPHRIPFKHSAMQRTPDIDEALGDDRLATKSF
jgi:hypothetical protein